MNITVLDTSTVTGDGVTLEKLEKLGNVTFCDRLSEDEIIEKCKDSEVIVSNKSKITERVIASCPKLRLVTLLATGYNNVDLVAAKKHGVTVSNSPDYSTDSVAQLTIAMILQFATKIAEYDKSVKNGDWVKCDNFCYFPYAMTEISGKTLGIIGYGAIGKRVAEIAKALGMHILANARTPKTDASVTFCDKDEIFAKSDYVTLHCPLNAETENLVSKRTLSLMKPSAVLINTSRGAVVNENDLCDALKRGVIAGAAVDVLDTEPMAADCPYIGAENLVITPHIGWATREARLRLVDIVCENIAAFASGKPQNVVN